MKFNLSFDGAIESNHVWLIDKLLCWVKYASEYGTYAKWFFSEEVIQDKPIEIKVVATDDSLMIVTHSIVVTFKYNSYVVDLKLATDDFKWITSYKWRTCEPHPSCWKKFNEFKHAYEEYLKKKES